MEIAEKESTARWKKLHPKTKLMEERDSIVEVFCGILNK